MADIQRTGALLRVTGETLDPDEITRLLGAPPDKAWRKGDTITVGRRQLHDRPFGRWSIGVKERSPGNLEDQINEILGRLTADLMAWRAVTSRYRADLFCGLFMEEWNEMMAIKPETLAAVGMRGIELELDIYGFDPDRKFVSHGDGPSCAPTQSHPSS